MRRVERVAGVVSLAAGGLHAMAGPAHVAEWWVYGVFFFGAAAAQAVYGLVLLTQGIEGWGGWTAVRRTVYGAGIAMTLAVIALWLVTRTIGAPVGPEAFEPEGIGFLDLSSKLVEAVLVVLLARLWWLSGRAAPAARRPAAAR